MSSPSTGIVQREGWELRPVGEKELMRKRAKRAIIASQRPRPFGKLRAGSFARLAQIPFGFAQGRLSGRKERLFGMTRRQKGIWLPPRDSNPDNLLQRQNF